MTTDSPDFTDMYRRFETLSPGAAAPLRRVTRPVALATEATNRLDDTPRGVPGFYRMFPGSRPTDQQARIAFFLPWCRKLNGGQQLAALCAERIAEARIVQIARTDMPDDLIPLRRLVIQLQPDLGWLELAPIIWFWGPRTKRKLVEDYYIALHKLDQGAKS